jgi:GT2 family glycosyltransferase
MITPKGQPKSNLLDERPFILAIIPSLSGKAEHLVACLRKQSWTPDQIQVIEGVRPNGRARNQGVAATAELRQTQRDQILVFIDDDALPGSDDLIEMLVEPILPCPGSEPEPVGVAGAARVLPQNAPWFQRRIAAEIPRTVNRVPSEPLLTDPPLVGYGHSLITTTCCAVRLSTYRAAGGFSEELTSGVDTDFFYRVRRLGMRFVMVPNVYVEHPAPKNLGELWNKFYWYGIGYSQEVRRRPQQKMGYQLPSPLHRVIFLLGATLWLIPNIFFLYSFGYPQFKLGFRPFKALSTYAVAWGYATGWRGGVS